ncbi:MAG TPA: amino acid permease [Gemmatimonadaceae bacterium]|nr:amino acid permease [Gemmatimonadaceae bacterium]
MIRERSEQSLVRALGTWGLAANIVNVTVGGGIFRLPAAASAALGAAAPVAYLVCAVAMGLIVLCFAEAGSRVSLTGGLYAYVEVAFGPLVGFLTGAMLWAGITAATAAVSSFFADALSALIPALAVGQARAASLVIVLVTLAALNIAGVRGASRFNVVMTLAKLLPLLLLVILGAASVNSGNLAWHATPASSDVARASAVLIFAFLGVETALVPSGEVRDTSKTVPRAIFIAMAIVTLLYLAIQIVTQGILGPALVGQKTPLAEAAAVALGVPGRTLILVGSAVSIFGYVSGMTLAVPRMLFAFGRDGFLPAPLAAVHERFRTPYVAIIVQTLIVIGLAVSGSFEKLAIIANGSILLVYAACCLAVIELRRRKVQESGAPFRVPFAAAIPVLAVLVIVWLMTSLTAEEWKALLVVVAVAIVVYAASLPSRRAAAPASAEST